MKKLLSAALAALCVLASAMPAPAQVPQAYQDQVSNRVTNIPVTPLNPLPVKPQASSTGGCSIYGFQSAASTNSTAATAVPTTLCGGVAINTTTTIYYLRLYDAASAPTCSSATNFKATIPIPPAPASGQAGGTLALTGTFGWSFAAGMSFCLTGGGTATDNTSAATGVYLALGFK